MLLLRHLHRPGHHTAVPRTTNLHGAQEVAVAGLDVSGKDWKDVPMSDFRGPCPRCGKLLPETVRRCECGALTGLAPRLRTARADVLPSPDPRPAEVTEGRYIVRECEGYEINMPIYEGATGALPGIECVVLDTAWNHRCVASFKSNQEATNHGRAEMFRRARERAAERCADLNRLDEIARSAAA